VPPDVRKQFERTIQDGQKTLHTAIKEVQKRLDRTARQADLDRAMKRLEGLSKQVRNLAAGSGASTAVARPVRRKPATRKPSARKPATRKAASPKPVTSSATPKRAPTRRATRRSARVVEPPSESTTDTNPERTGPGDF
jgi:hypothetical protein